MIQIPDTLPYGPYRRSVEPWNDQKEQWGDFPLVLLTWFDCGPLLGLRLESPVNHVADDRCQSLFTLYRGRLLLARRYLPIYSLSLSL